MRWVAVVGAVVTLAGCSEDAELHRSIEATRAYMNQPEVRARLDASDAEGRRQLESGRIELSPREIAIRDRTERDRNALTICNARGQTVAAQPQYTGPGLSGAIESAAQTSQSGQRVAEICWNTYRQTGVMPGY